MRFVCVLSSSAFVSEAVGGTQALVRRTFDEESAHKKRQRNGI